MTGSSADNDERAAQFQRQRLQAREPRHTSSRRTYEQLRSLIRTGLADADSRFHELAISQEFGASRNSVRVALSMLVTDGLISRAPRRGTVLANTPIDFSFDRILLRDVLPAEGEQFPLGVVTLEDGVMDTPDLVRELMGTTAALSLSYVQLGVQGDEPVFLRTGVAPLTVHPDEFFDRLRRVGGTSTENWSFNQNPEEPIADPQAFAERLRRSFLADFETLYGAPFGSTRNQVEVVPADHRTSVLLGVDPGAPLLLRQQYSFDSDGVAREYSFTHFRGDRASLSQSTRIAGQAS